MKKSIKKKTALIYIHGKDGNIGEIELYKKFFQKCDALGFDYKSQTPWEAIEEFKEYFNDISQRYNSIILIANSIGAFFAMSAIGNVQIEKAFFISPIVNMEKLIVDMMQWAGVTEAKLKEKQFIETSFGEVLSKSYKKAPTSISSEMNCKNACSYNNLTYVSKLYQIA